MAAATAMAVSAGIALTQAGLSFDKAQQLKKKQKEADASAASSMEAARKKLGVNYTEALSIPKEAYQLQSEAQQQLAAQALQAGIDSDRGASRMAGTILAQNQLNQRQVRSDMADRLFGLEAAKLNEDSRLRDLGVDLDEAQVEGAQIASMDAERRAAAQQQQALTGLTQGLKYGLGTYQKLYPNTGEDTVTNDAKVDESVWEGTGLTPTSVEPFSLPFRTTSPTEEFGAYQLNPFKTAPEIKL